MNAAELFVRCLEEEGVTRIFGVPGEENACFMMALDASDIEFVLTRHEQGAAFMAEVKGRLTGEAGVCLGTLGPGAANLVTGVADANMDRAPVVAITGQAESGRRHKESHQAMDVVGMFQPITKWATPVRNPDDVPEVVHKAFKLAVEEKPGAIHIELGEDVASGTATTIPFKQKRTHAGVPAGEMVSLALEKIRASKRPLVLAGNGVIREAASPALRRFVELTGIPVINTFMAKGVVDRHSPLSLFTIGLQARDLVACAIDDSDLVISIGYDMVEYDPRFWNPDGSKEILHIDSVPAEVDSFYRAEIEVVGDLKHALDMLTSDFERTRYRADGAIFDPVRQAMLQDFAEYADDDTEGAIRPQKVLWDVREVMGPADILLSDVGAHKMWIARYYQCDEPNTCLIPNGFASMGFALPGAISASLIHPDRKVLGIAGDGGFLMNVQEMETAKRLNSNIVMLIWEDQEYGLIAWKQNTQYGRHTDLSFGNPDFGQLAQAFGWGYTRVDRSRDLRSALEGAFREDGPSLVVLPIDYRENSLLTERLGEIACPL
ncbi:MAG: acetolactate synthase large subunit [Chloroflexi bacterium]|nr:acetolactate synthase large subunit [Chloroflexota bacterium]MBT4072425.1 acetolactate synthase large subunit [Chloroflexota bacterium]MBT4515289.1 acetolactate synthase large subunit [Chloroflexota bacterium]MBT5319961.1 acetolactate synthase large subunit [Chloroflexota bacterium]MBT6682687.1 acetolactate synthase large subunit [Chloroflexota bacterium]